MQCIYDHGGSDMKTILVANRKGGCGKTLVAITLAGALAARGDRVVLADADPQKSARRWGKARPKTAAKVGSVDWSSPKSLGDVPKKTDWLVIDSPGALIGYEAEVLIAEAKAVLTPVLPSSFDTQSTKRFLKDIDDIKRIRKGKVAVHLVANRVRPQARASARLVSFFDSIGRQPLAWISDRAAYSELAAEGLTVFDRPQKVFQPIRDQWAPVLKTLE